MHVAEYTDAVSWRLLGIRWRIREIGNKCNEIGILLPDTLFIHLYCIWQ